MAGFVLQLKILLWKNFTLKRRKLWVLLFEMFIPLVLFVILLAIRHKQPPKPITASSHNTKPIPSAGLLSILQEFCDVSQTDQYHLPHFPNSTVFQFLENLQSIAENNNFFDPGFTPDEMERIPELYRTIIDDPIAIKDLIDEIKDLEVEDIFKNATEIQKTLVDKFSLPPDGIDVVLHSRLNFTELYRVVFGLVPEDHKQFLIGMRQKRSIPNLSLLHPPTAVASGLIYKILRENPALFLDPEVMDVVAHLTGVKGSYADLDPKEVADVMKKILLSPSGLRHLSCDDKELDRLLIPQNPNDTNKIEITREALCNMTDKQFAELSKTLILAVSSEKIIHELHLDNLNITVARQHFEEFVTNVNEFVLFEKNLLALNTLADDFPQDACIHNVSASQTVTTGYATTLTPMNSTMDENSTTITKRDLHDSGNSHHISKRHSEEKLRRSQLLSNQYGGLLQIWLAMQTTICGKPAISSARVDAFIKTGHFADLGLTQQQSYDFGLLMHVLYSNPKVLYAPNNTQADDVIAKANGTFALIDKMSVYANKWLNVSVEIRDYLSLNKTAENLASIREMQLELRQYPEIVDQIQDPRVRDFIMNQTVPDPDFFLNQLTVVDNAACSWLELIKGINLNVYEGFEDEESLVEYFLEKAYHDNKTVFASVIFTNMNPDGSLPPHVIYKIRQNASLTDSTKFVRDRYWHPGPSPWSAQYYYQFGWSWIQDMIEHAIVEVHAGRDVLEPGAYIHQTPYPCYMADHFLFMIEHVMPLCMTISWVYSVAMLVQSIVYEKEQRLKEVMRMMGLSNAMHWLAWFISIFSQMSVTMLILTVMLKYGNVLMYSNPAIVFLALEIFALATISFSFLVSVCYSKAKVAAACAGIVYFLSYVPYMYVAIREEAAGDKIAAWVKSLTSLFSTTAFGLGAKYFAFYEIEGVGVQWDNIHISPVEGDQFNLFMVFLMMILDTLLYGLLTWYIENVHPGSYGLPKPWYFPFMASYWCGGHMKTESEQCSWRQMLNWCMRRNYQSLSLMEEDQACAIDQASLSDHHFEPEPSHIPLGVHIEGLTKRYKNGKLAVNNLSLNMYEGHITSFLGHNGAGKTTTMSILTGLFPPTKGYATIYGDDIRTDMDEIRRSLGMCPQHNVLFDKLTVDEHLWFYARLKGMNMDEIKEETDRMIEDLGLPKKRHSNTDCLSGGMKRKLSVAIAFVAGSRTVILDEPTAGVDPFARRAIWDLLIKYKRGRTILLSTHHMDEAEVLGDRIAIISNGNLKCSGSALFLKSTYGDGYHLTLVKKPSEDDMRSVDTLSLEEYVGVSFHTKCQEAAVTAFILDHIPSAYLKWESLQELHYILPFDEAHKGGFERLFQALDNSLSTLEIGSYGVMDTSLEEVFLKVTENAQKSAEEDNHENAAKESESIVSHPIVENRSINSDAPVMEPSSVTSALLDEEMRGRNSPGPGPPPRPHQGHHRTESNFSMMSTDSSLVSLLHEPSMLQNTSSTVQDFIRTHRRSGSHNSFFHQQFRPELIAMHTRHVEEDNTTPQHLRHRRTGSGVSYFSHQSLNAGSLGGATQDLHGAEGVAGKSTKHQGNTYHLLQSDEMSRDDSICDAPLGGKGSYILEGYLLLLQQFIAIIFKRYYYIKRNWKGLFSQILLPALFVCVAMTVALTAPQVTDLPEMVISTAQYYNYTQPAGNFIPYSDLNQDIGDATWSMDARGKDLVHTFRMPSGVGATCVLKKPFNSSFDDAILRQINSTHRNYTLVDKFFIPGCRDVFVKGVPLSNFVPPPPHGDPMPVLNDSDISDLVPKHAQEKFYPECHCTNDATGQVCRKDGFKSPPYFQAVTSEFLLDISGQPEETYYLHTNEIYRLHRYGGFTFGLVRNDVPENFGKNAPTEFRKIAVRHVTLVWFNHKGFHSMPIYVNALNNAILRANLPASKGNPAAYGITAINHPMNDTNNQLSLDSLTQGSDVLIAIFIICAMSFVPASFVLFLVYERYIRAKHLQSVSGLNRVVYWLANYFWDMCNFLIPATCCIVILRIFDIPAYVSNSNFPAVIALFLLYGWSITPMMYPASFVFNEPSTAYIFLIVINLFIGITCIITSFLLEMFQQNDPDLAKIHDVLKCIFLVFPNYCLGRGLMDVAFNEYKNEFFFKTGQYDKMMSPFAWDLTARNLVAMATTGLSFFLITILCEFRFFIKRKPAKSTNILPPLNEDVDVTNERRRVLRGRGQKDLLRIQNLTKVYKTRKLGHHMAVDRLCLGIPQGECFGLLGVNGAGKTTTFRMLTGDFAPTGGDAFINNYSIQGDIHHVQQNLGYCPQFDALYDELTGREHLHLYARLRGVPYHEQAQVVEWALDKLALRQYADRLSGTYSGGNKRKLSTAIALIGHPPIIFLDEPTTGMDPHSRRFLWDLILNLVREGRSVVLTSHSMEECEALCSRLAIMVNGRFRCIGSTQHLKNRFGDGYTISIRVRGPDYGREVDAVGRFMLRNFPECKLKESHHNMVQYELPSEHLSLSRVFSKMEEAMHDLDVEDYSVSQNTLDNVFINFVSQQQELIQEQENAAALPPSELLSVPHPVDSDDDTILDMGASSVADSGYDADVACLLDSRPSSCRASSLGIETDLASEYDEPLLNDTRTRTAVHQHPTVPSSSRVVNC